MAEGQTMFVTSSALRMDRHSRLWVDPKAVGLRGQSGKPPGNAVAITRSRDGFIVKHLPRESRRKKLWKAEPAADFFAGFLPVVRPF
jgi:hypothetical protein